MRLLRLGFPAALVLLTLVAGRAGAAPQRVAAPSTTVVKILVNKDGWYRVQQSTLTGVGFTPMTAANVRLYKGNPAVAGAQEVRIKYPSTAGPLEFYGQALDNVYADTRTYWLKEDPSVAGARVQTGVAAAGPTNLTGTFATTVNLRDRQSYFSAIVNGPANNFFSQFAILSGFPLSRSISSPNLDTAQDASLRVDLHGYSTGGHSITVAVEGSNYGPIAATGTVPMTGTFVLPGATLVNTPGTTSIDMSTSLAGDFTLGDQYTLTYKHFFKADSNALDFPVTPLQQVTVGDFTSADAPRLLDITDTINPRELAPTIAGSAGNYTMGIGSPAGASRLYAFSDAKVLAPKQVLADTPSNLRATTNRADFIIISYVDFRSAAQPLANQRASEGLDVDYNNDATPDTIDVQDVYDEFGTSNGSHDPLAIRDFLQYAKNSWTDPKPKYVLLVGDGTYDPRNFKGGVFQDKDFIPTLFVNAGFFPEPPSDDSMADFNDDGKPEIALGRLPVNSVAETTAMVSKIVGYANTAAWARSALLVADNFDRNDYCFGADVGTQQNPCPPPPGYSDYVAAQSLSGPPSTNNVSVTKVYRPSPPDDATTHNTVMTEASKGPTIVNWFGHGTPTGWAGSPEILNSSQAASLTNVNKLSLWLMMTCQNAYFVDASTPSIGEALLLAQNAGVAVWASSGDTVPTDQVNAAKVATNELFNDAAHVKRLGDTMLTAKNTLSDIDVLHTWTLLGDPTTKLKFTATPTSVGLKSFTAARSARGVQLGWRTANETGALGFNVYRVAGGKQVKINPSLVAAKRSGTARGATYQLVDRTARRGTSYTYRLQVVSLGGKRSWAATTAVRASR